MHPCIDLKERFGDRYKVQYEESYCAEYGPHGRTHEPWLLVIPCQHGHIYPHGDDLLGAATDKRGTVAKRLAALDGVRVTQDGDDGINAAFPVELFNQVARLMKPRKRRRLSPEHKAKLVEAGREALQRHQQVNSEAPETERTAAEEAEGGQRQPGGLRDAESVSEIA